MAVGYRLSVTAGRRSVVGYRLPSLSAAGKSTPPAESLYPIANSRKPRAGQRKAPPCIAAPRRQAELALRQLRLGNELAVHVDVIDHGEPAVAVRPGAEHQVD